jgi:pyruvate dehydrogenase E2 component (dihydrolipoamide acetyltransferase)
VAELKLPELGENIETVDVSAILVSVGDQVRLDQPVIEVETEKASLEVPSTFEGRVEKLLVSAGDKVAVGQVLLVVETVPGAAAKEAISEPATPEPVTPVPAPEAPSAAVAPPSSRPAVIGTPVPAAPSVRALARELGVEIAGVPGTGRGGRISRDDVKAHAKRLISGAATPAGPASAPELPDFSRWGAVRREPMSAVRRATLAGMTRSWTTVPHVTQFDDADITHLEALRRSFNQRPEAAGRKLTVTAVVVKLVAAGLRRFPELNASIDAPAEAVVFKDYVSIGVAVDTERGLLVPVIRDTDTKRLVQVVEELADLAERARSKKIKPDEMQGATFTVTNLGGLGTTHFSPIVNWPEVAILGVGRAETRPVMQEGQFVPRLMLPLSLSYDHRLVDGANAARFLRWVAEALEQPLLLCSGLDGRS